MLRACLLCGVFCLVGGVLAEQSAWQLKPQPLPMSEADQALIGRTVCGKDGYEVEEGVLRCDTCPEFTGSPGSREGLEIGSLIQGRFSSSVAGIEWLLDTDGCEAHFESFGGAILLGPIPPKPVGKTPKTSAAAGTEDQAADSDRSTKLIFYKPGFRVNDCLVFDGEKSRSLLVCNEADMAQGEVIGHISVMEITRRGINRWRLLRWYDNSGSDMQEVLSVVPVEMKAMKSASGTSLLQIRMSILETNRTRYDQTPEPQGKVLTLEFSRMGQRFFPTRQTLGHLTEIGSLTRKMLDSSTEVDR